MSDKIKVYQKPTCSKCRMTIGRLKEQGAAFETINYYEKPLSFDELRKLVDKLSITPRDLLRKGERVYRDLKMAAAQERRPISEVIQVAVTDYLNQKKRKAGHRSGLKRFLASPALRLTDEQFRETMEADFYDQ